MQIDLDKYFNTETMKKAAYSRNQIVAMSLPFIISNESIEYSLVYADKGLVFLQNQQGERCKVVSSSGKTFNLYPSFTKGIGRTSAGVKLKKELEKDKIERLILVSIVENKASVTHVSVKNIPSSGIMHV